MSIEKAVNESLENFWEYYESGEFEPGLKVIEKFGISDEVINFTFNPNSYYIPNKRNNRFVTPAGTPDDRVPVIGLDDGDRYRFRKSTVHALQRVALQNLDINPDFIASELEMSSDEISHSGGSPGTASVLTHRVTLDGSTRLVESAPTVLLNTGYQDGTYLATCPGVILHELVHVAQCLNNPVLASNDTLQKELEAYAVQATLVHSYKVPYSMGTAMAGEVDSFRKRNLGDDIYQPTNEFKTALINTPILKKIAKE